jgi:Holliday junction DNA helicase RuvA
MYAYIKGEVAEIGDTSIVIDNNGIGYNITVPGSVTESGISIGDEVKIYTHFAVREDAMQLYGFISKADLAMFRLLLNVNGIGPKAACAILSGLSADDLRFAVLSDDAASIAKAPGVGRKTAQKIILELKDKVDLQDAFELKAAHTEEKISKNMGNSNETEAVMALTALGYSNTQALRAVKSVSGKQGVSSVEDLLKAALKELF